MAIMFITKYDKYIAEGGRRFRRIREPYQPPKYSRMFGFYMLNYFILMMILLLIVIIVRAIWLR